MCVCVCDVRGMCGVCVCGVCMARSVWCVCCVDTHFFRVEHEVAITPDSVGQATTCLPPQGGGPDSLVVVQEICKMVLNKVLPGDTQV